MRKHNSVSHISFKRILATMLANQDYFKNIVAAAAQRPASTPAMCSAAICAGGRVWPRAREGKRDQRQPVEIVVFLFQIQVKSRSEQVDR
jgi:hypothetical protein